MTNEFLRGSWPQGYKYPECRLGQRGADWALKWAGPAGLGRPAWAHFDSTSGLLRPVLVPNSSTVFPNLHVGPCRQFLFGLDEAPCPARFGSFLTGSSEFFIFSGLVPGLFRDMFTSLLDLYRASWSCHEVLNELIPEVLLSTQILHKH
jgi:hypothetical protein